MWVALFAAFPAGCANDPQVGLDSSDPTGRMIALREAAAAASPTDEQVRGLIEGLDSDDAAVRQICVLGLSRLAGRDFGYEPGGEAAQREPAAERWRDWYASRTTKGGSR